MKNASVRPNAGSAAAAGMHTARLKPVNGLPIGAGSCGRVFVGLTLGHPHQIIPILGLVIGAA